MPAGGEKREWEFPQSKPTAESPDHARAGRLAKACAGRLSTLRQTARVSFHDRFGATLNEEAPSLSAGRPSLCVALVSLI